jgi:hypothetical protein
MEKKQGAKQDSDPRVLVHHSLGRHRKSVITTKVTSAICLKTVHSLLRTPEPHSQILKSPIRPFTLHFFQFPLGNRWCDVWQTRYPLLQANHPPQTVRLQALSGIITAPPDPQLIRTGEKTIHWCAGVETAI